MVDSHKVWLIASISIAILVIAGLVFVPMMQGNFAGQAIKYEGQFVLEDPPILVGRFLGDSVCANRAYDVETPSSTIIFNPTFSDGLCFGVYSGVPIIKSSTTGNFLFGINTKHTEEGQEFNSITSQTIWKSKCPNLNLQYDALNDIEKVKACIESGKDNFNFYNLEFAQDDSSESVDSCIIEGNGVSVGSTTVDSVCFQRIGETGLSGLNNVKSYQCNSVYKGVPIIKASSQNFYTFPISSSSGFILGSSLWAENCPGYYSSPSDTNGWKEYTTSYSTYHVPLTIDEAKKCIDSGKDRFVPLYDNSCETFGSLETCTPQCNGDTCGSDGCGGSCGTCTGSSNCDEGKCIAFNPLNYCSVDGGGVLVGAESLCKKRILGMASPIPLASSIEGKECLGVYNGIPLVLNGGGIHFLGVSSGKFLMYSWFNTNCPTTKNGEWDDFPPSLEEAKFCVVETSGRLYGTTKSELFVNNCPNHPCDFSCNGKECGLNDCGDPCGSLNGVCGTGEICEENICVCQPSCDGKTCGSDGCGGSCGSCTQDKECQSGNCVSYNGLCTDGAPKNSQLCPYDHFLFGSSPRVLVESCTEETKCEFICKEGYAYENGVCVSTSCINECVLDETGCNSGTASWECKMVDGCLIKVENDCSDQFCVNGECKDCPDSDFNLSNCGNPKTCGWVEDQTYNLTDDAEIDNMLECFGITSPGITLDCAGNTISSRESVPKFDGIVIGESGVELKNCLIKGFDRGVYVKDKDSSGNSINGVKLTNISASGNNYGVEIHSDNSYIKEGLFYNNNYVGIFSSSSGPFDDVEFSIAEGLSIESTYICDNGNLDIKFDSGLDMVEPFLLSNYFDSANFCDYNYDSNSYDCSEFTNNHRCDQYSGLIVSDDLKDLGESCTDYTECSSGICHLTYNVCSAGAVGSICISDSWCISGECCFDSDCEPNTCIGELSEENEFCINDGYCGPGLVCDENNFVCTLSIDSDGDGILDSVDACPNSIGVVENDGCFIADFDKNDVVNASDFDQEYERQKYQNLISNRANQGLNDLNAFLWEVYNRYVR
jgi:hypothetical protein